MGTSSGWSCVTNLYQSPNSQVPLTHSNERADSHICDVMCYIKLLRECHVRVCRRVCVVLLPKQIRASYSIYVCLIALSLSLCAQTVFLCLSLHAHRDKETMIMISISPSFSMRTSHRHLSLFLNTYALPISLSLVPPMPLDLSSFVPKCSLII